MRSIFLLVLTVACCSSGCSFLRAPQNPIVYEFHPSGSPTTGLVVFLPGFGDVPERFRQNKLVSIVHDQTGFDVAAVDAHFGYYRKFSIVDRLHEDVIEPFVTRYTHIWLVGVSMGGFGATSYAMEHPEHVTGIMLLAPYLGRARVVTEVADAGGLAHWQAPVPNATDDARTQHSYRLWRWLKRHAVSSAQSPILMLGFGAADRGPGSNLLEAVLPPAQVKVLPGGHKWSTWVPLFESMLAQWPTRELDRIPQRPHRLRPEGTSSSETRTR